MSLVAFHSNATDEARLRGHLDDLHTAFTPAPALLADILTHADMTTTPTGHRTSVRARFAEILTRYPDGDLVHTAIATSAADLTATVDRIDALLAARTV